MPGVRAEMYLTTRWASALPIRQAAALDQFGAVGLDGKRARALLEGAPDPYVIEIPGFPAGMIRQDAGRFEADLAKSAQLFFLDENRSGLNPRLYPNTACTSWPPSVFPASMD